jgi:hypothetical protein
LLAVQRFFTCRGRFSLARWFGWMIAAHSVTLLSFAHEVEILPLPGELDQTNRAPSTTISAAITGCVRTGTMPISAILDSPNDCRKHATECIRLMRRAKAPRVKQALRARAAIWLKRATEDAM